MSFRVAGLKILQGCAPYNLLELLPHNLKQKGIIWHPLKILQDSQTFSKNLGESYKILKISLTI